MFFQDLQREFPGFYNSEDGHSYVQNRPTGVTGVAEFGGHLSGLQQIFQEGNYRRLPSYGQEQSVTDRFGNQVTRPAVFSHPPPPGLQVVRPRSPLLSHANNQVLEALPTNFVSLEQQMTMYRQAGIHGCFLDINPGQYVFVPHPHHPVRGQLLPQHCHVSQQHNLNNNSNNCLNNISTEQRSNCNNGQRRDYNDGFRIQGESVHNFHPYFQNNNNILSHNALQNEQQDRRRQFHQVNNNLAHEGMVNLGLENNRTIFQQLRETESVPISEVRRPVHQHREEHGLDSGEESNISHSSEARLSSSTVWRDSYESVAARLGNIIEELNIGHPARSSTSLNRPNTGRQVTTLRPDTGRHVADSRLNTSRHTADSRPNSGRQSTDFRLDTGRQAAALRPAQHQVSGAHGEILTEAQPQFIMAGDPADTRHSNQEQVPLPQLSLQLSGLSNRLTNLMAVLLPEDHVELYDTLGVYRLTAASGRRVSPTRQTSNNNVSATGSAQVIGGLEYSQTQGENNNITRQNSNVHSLNREVASLHYKGIGLQSISAADLHREPRDISNSDTPIQSYSIHSDNEGSRANNRIPGITNIQSTYNEDSWNHQCSSSHTANNVAKESEKVTETATSLPSMQPNTSHVPHLSSISSSDCWVYDEGIEQSFSDTASSATEPPKSLDRRTKRYQTNTRISHGGYGPVTPVDGSHSMAIDTTASISAISYSSQIPAQNSSLQPTMNLSLPSTLDPSVQPAQRISQQSALDLCLWPTKISSVQCTSEQPVYTPSVQPAQGPSSQPISGPSQQPSLGFSIKPAVGPSQQPSLGFSIEPIAGPSQQLALGQSLQSAQGPSLQPSQSLSLQPAYGSSQQTAHGQRQQTAHGPSQLTAHDQNQLTAHGLCHPTAHGQNQQTAHGPSQLTAHDHNQLTAHGLSQPTAHGQSQQTSHGPSLQSFQSLNQQFSQGPYQLTACGQSQLTVHGPSQLTTHGQSQQLTYGPSQQTAHGPGQLTAHGPSLQRSQGCSLQRHPSLFDNVSERAWRQRVHCESPASSAPAQTSTGPQDSEAAELMAGILYEVSDRVTRSRALSPDWPSTLHLASHDISRHGEVLPAWRNHLPRFYGQSWEGRRFSYVISGFFRHLIFQFFYEVFAWIYISVAANPHSVGTWALLQMIAGIVEQTVEDVTVAMLAGFMEGFISSTLPQVDMADMILQEIEEQGYVWPDAVSTLTDLAVVLNIRLDPRNMLRRFSDIVRQAARNFLLDPGFSFNQGILSPVTRRRSARDRNSLRHGDGSPERRAFQPPLATQHIHPASLPLQAHQQPSVLVDVDPVSLAALVNSHMKPL